MNRWHSETVAQLLQELDARPGGLSPHQAEERLRRYGPNELEPPRQEGLLGRILGQLKDPMILVLLGAAGVSLAASGGEDWLDAVIILVIVVVNGIISISQEDRAQQALEELRKLSSPQAAVLRGGKVTKIPAAQLVPGDIIRLEAGDFIPADARLLKSVSLKSEESALTGESVPAEKDADQEIPENAPLGDRANMAFSGCSVTYGTATAVVTARRAGTTASLDVLTKHFTNAQMPVVSSTYWNMVFGPAPEQAVLDQEGLQTMRNLGRNLAWLLQCIQAGREQGLLPPEAEHLD